MNKHDPNLTVDQVIEYAEHLEELCKAEHARASEAIAESRKSMEPLLKLFPGFYRLMDDFVLYCKTADYSGWDDDPNLINLLGSRYEGFTEVAHLFRQFIAEWGEIK